MATQLGFPPGYRFVPTDEEVVGLHLLPRILDQPLPLHDIIVDDPLSAPPWALLEKHGRKQEAFFFASGQPINAKGNRQKRTCKGGGTWQGQGKRKRQGEGKVKESKKRMRVTVCGCTREIEWEMYALNFHENSVKGSTGWVMHEYSITSPPEFAQSPMRAYCIRQSGHGKNAKKHSQDEDWGSEDEDDNEADHATLATTWCAIEEDPPLLIGEYPLDPQADYVISLPAAAADVVDANTADGTGAGASNGLATTWCAAEEDASLLIDEYLLAPQPDYVLPLPVAAADDVGVNPADGAGAGAGNGQDLPDDGTLATTWCAAEENPDMLIGEYQLAPQADHVIPLPVAVADDVDANPADRAGAGVGNGQDLPDDATFDTTWFAAEEDPALLIGEYLLPPQADHVIPLPVAASADVNANPADGVGAGAGNSQDLPDDATLATTWCAIEEDSALLVGEYLLAPHADYVIPLPVAAADDVNANIADGVGAGAGNGQDLPALVEDDDLFAFINSLSDLVPCFDLSQ